MADVGWAAVDKAEAFGGNYTILFSYNPVAASGNINKIYCYVGQNNGAGIKLGVWRSDGGDDFSCIQNTAIAAGTGYKEVEVDWDVLEGDYIGYYAPINDTVDRSATSEGSYENYWFLAGDQTGGSSATYTAGGSNTRSYSIGADLGETSTGLEGRSQEPYVL